MNDLTEWNKEIDNQIAIAKTNNEKNFRACKNCGDSGKTLGKEYANNMNYLCMNYCTCNIGINLRNKHITKINKEK